MATTVEKRASKKFSKNSTSGRVSLTHSLFAFRTQETVTFPPIAVRRANIISCSDSFKTSEFERVLSTNLDNTTLQFH